MTRFEKEYRITKSGNLETLRQRIYKFKTAVLPRAQEKA